MKRALVTGGSGAIGAAICRRLANQELHVLVHANSHPQAAQQVVDEITDTGGSAEACCFDLTDENTVTPALENILEQGPIQVLIHNAGIHDDAPLAGMSFDQWRSVIDVSLHGFYHVTQPLILPMLRTRWGRIITLSSIAGVMGNRGQANYAAAKAGLHGAAKSLAIESASRGVTVNVVAPGVIDSPMTSELFDKERINQLVPMKRTGTPDEVAGLIAYLCSDDAGYITGQVISINGGMA